MKKAAHMQAMRELKSKFSSGDMSALPEEEEMQGSPLLSILIGMGKKPSMEEEEEPPMTSEEEQLRSA